MGDIYLDLTVANIHDRERQKEISFLADTGATRAWLPKEAADELGITPMDKHVVSRGRAMNAKKLAI